jgi:hypothetical protein
MDFELEPIDPCDGMDTLRRRIGSHKAKSWKSRSKVVAVPENAIAMDSKEPAPTLSRGLCHSWSGKHFPAYFMLVPI